jgi:hypothetical protein
MQFYLSTVESIFKRRIKPLLLFSTDLYRDEQDKRKEIKTVKYSVFI